MREDPDAEATLPLAEETPSLPQPSGSGPTRRKFGRYELVQELGRGGMGVVYKADHPTLKSYLAIKVLLAGGHASAEETKRFQREAQAAARLKPPGVLGVHDIGEEEGKTYFAMEYIEGASLDKLLDDPVRFGVTPGKGTGPGRPGINVATALQFTRETADALQFAHEAGVVHLDLKPANVIRDARTGGLKVTDFGLAKLVDAPGAGATGATRTGTLLGTPACMSPEQTDGRVKELDAQSDVYQIGAILYELLTGRPPYAGENPMDVVLKVMNEDPSPCSPL